MHSATQLTALVAGVPCSEQRHMRSGGCESLRDRETVELGTSGVPMIQIAPIAEDDTAASEALQGRRVGSRCTTHILPETASPAYVARR